jgi:hypothetical protein
MRRFDIEKDPMPLVTPGLVERRQVLTWFTSAAVCGTYSPNVRQIAHGDSCHGKKRV